MNVKKWLPDTIYDMSVETELRLGLESPVETSHLIGSIGQISWF